MKQAYKYLMAILLAFSCGGALLAVASPQLVSAADDCNRGFLGFPAWYRGLTDEDCNIKSPSDSGGLSTFIWRIVINVIEMALVLIAYASGGFLLYSGFMFLTSSGNPDQATKSRQSMLNAIIGMVIAISAAVLVNFITSRLF